MTAVPGVLTSYHLMRSTQRSLGWTRILLALFALVVNVARLDTVRQPGVLIAITVFVLLWSIALAYQNRLAMGWQRVVVGIDVGLALVLVGVSRWVVGPDTFPPAPVYWQLAAPLGVAVLWGGWAGLGTAAAVSAVTLLQTPINHTDLWTLVFTTCITAWGVGQLVDTLRKTTAERDRSLAASMALAERDRMNRIVHDGALQVLSMVEREGRTLGPRGERLAQLARQQEIQLRTVLQDRTVDMADDETEKFVDISAMLDAMSTDRVTVSRMAGSVLMPLEQASEVRAAVAQILLNSELHAGPDAQVWMLLEEEDEAITISVRDNGVGMTREQVQAAFEAGRLGIRESIIGRLHEIGGTAEVRSSPGRGVEWELRIPVTACVDETDTYDWPDADPAFEGIRSHRADKDRAEQGVNNQ
ncbi:sensor histidine kinase [Propionibacteriaceae bacterium G1746]|uniref:sensor histidine kinase n=1 Tax=Aestuariimicrobium sp. G57 TaxID=3418485 RepID=UPI003C24952B